MGDVYRRTVEQGVLNRKERQLGFPDCRGSQDLGQPVGKRGQK